MRKNSIETMLKVSLVKKVKEGRKTIKEKLDDLYIILEKDRKGTCDVFIENLEGKENRKHPQFIKKYTISRPDVENLITLINSSYFKNPFLHTSLVQTALYGSTLSIFTKSKRKEKKLFTDMNLEIVDITKVKRSSELFNFREKLMSRNITGKIERPEVIDCNFRIEFKSQLEIVDIEHLVFNEYQLYFREGKTRKSVIVSKDFNGNYVSATNKIEVEPDVIRSLNLKIRPYTSIMDKRKDKKVIELLFANPILKSKNTK